MKVGAQKICQSNGGLLSLDLSLPLCSLGWNRNTFASMNQFFSILEA